MERETWAGGALDVADTTFELSSGQFSGTIVPGNPVNKWDVDGRVHFPHPHHLQNLFAVLEHDKLRTMSVTQNACRRIIYLSKSHSTNHVTKHEVGHSGKALGNCHPFWGQHVYPAFPSINPPIYRATIFCLLPNVFADAYPSPCPQSLFEGVHAKRHGVRGNSINMHSRWVFRTQRHLHICARFGDKRAPGGSSRAAEPRALDHPQGHYLGKIPPRKILTPKGSG